MNGERRTELLITLDPQDFLAAAGAIADLSPQADYLVLYHPPHEADKKRKSVDK